MAYRLRITTPDGKARRVTLSKLPVTLGRGEECDVTFPDHQASRKHFRLEAEGGTGNLRALDLASTNGLYVNGRKVERAVVDAGDRIRAGETIIEVESDVDVAFTEEKNVRLDILKSVSFEKKGGDARRDRKDSLFARLCGEGGGGQGAASERSKERLFGLVRLIDALFEAEEESAFFEAALRAAIDGWGVERAALLLRNPTTGTLEPTSSLARDDLTGRIVISRTICGYAYGKREAVVTTDAGADPRFEQGSSILEGGVRAVVCVPIPGAEKVLGVLYGASDEKNARFDEDDLVYGGAVAQLIGVFRSFVSSRAR